MSTFGERLSAAMLAAGITDAEDLARRCVGVSKATAKNAALRWLALDKAELSADTAYRLAKCLNVRAAWLISGEAAMPFGPDAAEALRIIDHLSPAQTKRWLRAGRRMLGEP